MGRNTIWFLAGLVGVVFLYVVVLHTGRPPVTPRRPLLPMDTVDNTCWRGHPGHDVTLVTMYLNIGKFQKGEGGGFHYTTEGYLSWMKTWASVNNTVVAFFDNQTIMDTFKKIRSAQPSERTIAMKIRRSELDAFKDLKKTEQIFAQPNYPKHHPNTVKAEYSCSVSAKVDVLDMVMTSLTSHVTTKYIAWLDMGYFRLLTDPAFNPAGKTYKLEAPENFDDRTVGFSETLESPKPLSHTPWQIIQQNIVWVASGLILGTPKVMQQYVTDFRQARQEMMGNDMMSTGQQVIAALYSGKLKTQPLVKATTYTCTEGQFGLHSSDRQYFCFGFKCKQAAEIRTNSTLSSC